MSYQQPPDGAAWPHQAQSPQGPPPSRQPQPYYGQNQAPPARHDQQGYQQPGYQGRRAAAGKRYSLHGAEPFWYILGCVGWGAAYFAKIPTKKAACEVVSELQLDGRGPSNGYVLGGAESFWYILMCITFGGGYLAKVYAKKALWEVVTMLQSAPGDSTDAICRALRGAPAPAAY